MKLVRMWYENTDEGKDYLTFNGYKPICRLSKSLWLVTQIGNKVDNIVFVKSNDFKSKTKKKEDAF